MKRENIYDEYFNWLYNLVCEDRFASNISYRKLLGRLHEIEFIYSIRKDRSRASDGIDLRYRFADERLNGNLPDGCMDQPCSVLEMMVALALRCEETIMDDPQVGNRTGQWFWSMINNLRLGTMIDSRYNEETVDDVIHTLLYREYEPNGYGGLFTIKDCEYDLRRVEIWTIMLWYLDSFNRRPRRH